MMFEYILDMGPMGLINIFIFAFIIIFALKNFYQLYIKKTHKNLSKLGRSINTMLFWGAIVVVLGFLGTFLGLLGAIDSVLKSGTKADVRVLLGGISLVLKLLIFSLTSFTVISIVWYLFTAQHRKLLERSMKEAYASDISDS
ncbi:hypothetical protein ACFL50_01595 [Candidatus Latescibacterota bacterium]